MAESDSRNPNADLPGITIVGPAYPHRGGIAHYTACLARALSEYGCRVQLISFRRLYPRLLFPGRTEFDSSDEPIQFPSARILTPTNPFRWLAAMRAVGRFSPDLAVVAWWHSWFFPCTAFCLGWLRWIQRRRVVLLCHNIGSHDRRVADRVAWRFLSRLPDVHLVHASDDPARILALNPKARVIRLPHPTYDIFSASAVTREEARQILHLDPSDEVCLFFGLVRPYKGLALAIEAMNLLRDRPRLRLVVAGEFYEPREPYDRLIARHGLTDRVFFHDHYIPNEAVAIYFRAADLLVAPHRSVSHSGVVQIARGFGLPVVAGDVGGMKDLVSNGRTGLLVPPADAQALAAAIARFFNQALAGPFRQNLEMEKGRFSWSTLAETLCRLARD
jgi:glycosyltransferase involved in cell wall biosynthesis